MTQTQRKRAMSGFGTAVLIGCISVLGLAEYNIVQTIPVFYDCSCDRTTDVYVMQLAERVVAYGWAMYTSQGEYIIGQQYESSPHKTHYLDLCRMFNEHAPAGVDAKETAWGLLAIDLLDDPDSGDALRIRVEHTAPTRSLGSTHIAYPAMAHQDGSEARVGAFYRATPGNHNALIVVNSVSREIQYTVDVRDWDGEPILTETFVLQPLASERHPLLQMLPSPAGDSYQGALTVTVDSDDFGALLFTWAHYFYDELCQYEPLP